MSGEAGIGHAAPFRGQVGGDHHDPVGPEPIFLPNFFS
jgi:hypothetical protein